jgi:hypothetical protein
MREAGSKVHNVHAPTHAYEGGEGCVGFVGFVPTRARLVLADSQDRLRPIFANVRSDEARIEFAAIMPPERSEAVQICQVRGCRTGFSERGCGGNPVISLPCLSYRFS